MMEIGRHRIVVGGASLETAQSLMPTQREADLVYTDPPWGPSTLHMFDTMNKSAYQEWETFCSKLAAAIDWAAKGPVGIFMGTKWMDDTLRPLQARGFHVIQRTVLEYGSPVWWESLGRKKRLEATYAQLDRDPNVLAVRWPSLTLHGMATISDVIKQTLPDSVGKVIYDPCAGFGIVPKAALKHGAIFRGSDINESRLSVTAQILQKQVA